MIEAEIKLPIRTREAVESALQNLGFLPSSSFCEEDIYFDNASGQIRKNGEALRVRTITDLQTGQKETVITYKGKKLDTVSTSRKELETGVADGEVCMQILEALGFQAVQPQVKKTRQEYQRERMTACVDEVQDLGTFLELEMVISEEESREEALQEIDRVLQRLGYNLKDTTRTSYLSMLQQVEDD